ncbi:hypothetical protein MNBD_GAMMA22-3002 [hydrothermal vent metagenome]|uniref:Outer membrane protein assembly factor BamE domain-containing protein n=1 Tax=hydrothermal vent metagenome TaxID=652676 RepID=A0A3B1A4B5_9ZZZZ
MGISLSACSIYEIDIQQGNVLDEEAVAKLKVGMTKQQVQFILGSPIIKDAFHPERWDYVQTFRPGKGVMKRHTLSIVFKQNKVVKIDESGEKIDLEKITTYDKSVGNSSGGGKGHSH